MRQVPPCGAQGRRV